MDFSIRGAEKRIILGIWIICGKIVENANVDCACRSYCDGILINTVDLRKGRDHGRGRAQRRGYQAAVYNSHH